MNKMKKIEIKNLKGTLLFKHTAENNTLAKTLERAVIHGVNLLNAKLMAEQLIDIDLRHARLRGADLRFTIFRGTDLRGSKLRNADLRNADLTGAKYAPRQIDSAITDETTIL